MTRKLLTRSELGALLGVTGTSNFQRWERAGLPTTIRQRKRGAGGSKEHVYDQQGALEWIRDHAGVMVSQRARQILGESESKREESPVVPSVKKEGMEEEMRGLDISVDQAQESVQFWFRERQQQKENGNLQLAALAEKSHLEAINTLVRVSRARLEEREEMGELVNAADLTGRHLKIITSLKNNLLTVADSVIPIVLPYMRDAADAAAVKRAISDKIKDALRSTATTGNFDEGGT